MKKFILIFILAVAPITYSGPPNAEAEDEATYLVPFGVDGTGTEKNKALILQESIALISSFIPREMRPKYENTEPAVGWFNSKKVLCQIRCGSSLSKEQFEQCLQKGKWKLIETPAYYLEGMHSSDPVLCYDGMLDGCATHILRPEGGTGFMIVAEVKKPDATIKPPEQKPSKK